MRMKAAAVECMPSHSKGLRERGSERARVRKRERDRVCVLVMRSVSDANESSVLRV